MRFCRLALVLFAALALRGAEIRDVLKSAEIDAVLGNLTARRSDRAIHERPNYSVWLKVHDGRPGPHETHDDADDVLVIRRGAGRLVLGERTHEIGAGDVVLIPRKTPHQIDPGGGRLDYVVVRISPGSEGDRQRAGIRPATGRLDGVLKKSQIDATLAKFDANQPIHSAPNFTMNYVIYKGRVGPWESHAGCVDIYFIQTGTAVAQIGGDIQNAKEESPGEPRGTGVTGAREHQIGPGDLVVIPRNTAHHMNPATGKLGYILMKVWVD